MGTWGTEPFGGDAAADFAAELDAMAEDRRLAALRVVLTVAAEEADYLEAPEAEVAVAAAALLAAGRPGGVPVDPVHGPRKPIPQAPPELAALAVRALDRVLAAESELAELWDGTGDGAVWRASVDALRQALGPAPAPQLV